METGIDVDFSQGNAARMPFPDEYFDFLLGRAAFENFTSPWKSFKRYIAFSSTADALSILRRDTSNESVRAAVDRWPTLYPGSLSPGHHQAGPAGSASEATASPTSISIGSKSRNEASAWMSSHERLHAKYCHLRERPAPNLIY